MALWITQSPAAQVAQVRFPWSINCLWPDEILSQGLRWQGKWNQELWKGFFQSFQHAEKIVLATPSSQGLMLVQGLVKALFKTLSDVIKQSKTIELRILGWHKAVLGSNLAPLVQTVTSEASPQAFGCHSLPQRNTKLIFWNANHWILVRSQLRNCVIVTTHSHVSSRYLYTTEQLCNIKILKNNSNKGRILFNLLIENHVVEAF